MGCWQELNHTLQRFQHLSFHCGTCIWRHLNVWPVTCRVWANSRALQRISGSHECSRFWQTGVIRVSTQNTAKSCSIIQGQTHKDQGPARLCFHSRSQCNWTKKQNALRLMHWQMNTRRGLNISELSVRLEERFRPAVDSLQTGLKYEVSESSGCQHRAQWGVSRYTQIRGLTSGFSGMCVCTSEGACVQLESDAARLI